MGLWIRQISEFASDRGNIRFKTTQFAILHKERIQRAKCSRQLLIL